MSLSEMTFVSAFLMGLLGSVHCITMCGSLVGCFSYALPTSPQRTPYLVLLNLGRISCYTLQGALVGVLGLYIMRHNPVIIGRILSMTAASMMCLMGLYLMGLWRILTYIEQAGSQLWHRLTRFRKRLIPLDTPIKAYLLGLCWGGLPCGLVYSTLTLALEQQDLFNGALLMACFGMGTLPSMFLLGSSMQRVRHWMQRYQIQPLLGLLMFVMGMVFLLQQWPLLGAKVTCH